MDELMIETPAAEYTYFPSSKAIKALEGEGRIGGYLVVFGDASKRDLQGEYFTADTDYALHMYDKRPALYHHGLDDTMKGQVIGYIDTLRADEVGLWAEAQLDIRNMYVQKVQQLVDRGVLAWSSGSLPQLVEVDPSGHIRRWPIVEGSLTPSPAEPRRTNVQSIKSAINALEECLITPEEPAAVPAAKVATENPTTSANAFPKQAIKSYRGAKMTDVQAMSTALQEAGFDAQQTLDILNIISGSEGGTTEPPPEPEVPAEVTPEVPSDAMMSVVPSKGQLPAKGLDAKQVATVVGLMMEKQMQAIKTAPATETLPAGGTGKGGVPVTSQSKIEVRSKYAELSPMDMDYLRTLRNATKGYKWNPDEYTKFTREMVDRAQKSYGAGSLKLDAEDGKRLLSIKANELNSTAAADDGGDWVPTLWSSDLWERMRIDNNIASAFMSVDMPSASYELPIESDDPTVYSVAESTTDDTQVLTGSGTFTGSKVKTDKVTLTAKKLGLQTQFSAEVQEDAIIQFMPQLRNQALRSMQNGIDNVLANADATTGTLNINYADGNTSSVSTAKFLYGGGDGLRHLALVDNTTLVTNAANASPTLTMLRAARFKLTNAYAVRPSDLVWFCDVQTWGKLLNIDELLVWMNNGQGSTVNTGVVPTIDGSEVYASEEIGLTNASGFVSATGANNTLGQMILAHKPSWKVGYRRRIATDVTYLPYFDSYVLTITVRLAFKNRDTGCAAVIRNINVS